VPLDKWSEAEHNQVEPPTRSLPLRAYRAPSKGPLHRVGGDSESASEVARSLGVGVGARLERAFLKMFAPTKKYTLGFAGARLTKVYIFF
jgi:hypothetical protein